MARNIQPEQLEPRTSASERKFRRQMILGWIFVAFWFAFVGGFDVYLITRVAKQVHSGSAWQQTTGVVKTSRVITGRTSKGGTTYRPEVTYAYSVAGSEFAGSTIEAGGVGFSGNARASRVTQANPADATVPVYFDPSDPADSALMVGFQSRTLVMVMFIIPFNAVLVGMIAFLLRARRYAGDPLLGRIILDDGNRAVLRFAQFTPLTAGCLGLGVASFVGIFVAMFGWDGEPPVHISCLVIGAAFGIGFFIAFWRASAIAAGKFDIEIDRAFKRVTLPQSRKTYGHESLKFSDVVVRIESDNKRKLNNRPAWKLLVSGKSTDDPAFIAYWLSPTDARKLAKWLSKETGTSLECASDPDDDE